MVKATQARTAAARSLTESVFERLRTDILSGTLAPGSKLKINDLCEQLEVSLGAVREALSRLSAEGLVVAVAQRGFQVAPISSAELEDLTRVRIDIESLALRRAIGNGGLDWESGLVAAFHFLSKTPGPDAGTYVITEAWADAHSAFHSALVSACGSPWLMKIRTALYEQSERYRRLTLPFGDAHRDVNTEHREIMEAALKRDADRAVRVLTDHLQATSRILLESEKLRALQASERD